jgi:hypothetical protein
MARIHIEYAAACDRIRQLQSEVTRQRAALARHDAWSRGANGMQSAQARLDAYDHLLLAREHLREGASALAGELPEAAARLLALAEETERTAASDERGRRPPLHAVVLEKPAPPITMEPQVEAL